MLKHAVTTLLEDCKPLTNDILQLLVSSYRDTPQACIINLSKMVCILFLRCKILLSIKDFIVKS